MDNNIKKPSPYDWFKNKGGTNKGKKDWKGQTKTVWKFTKIFLYFSIFFFSMWGCVQVFVTKTQTNVGTGVELYSSKDNISPQVFSWHINGDKETLDVTHSVDNIYVNKKEDGAIFAGIQNELKAQGVTSMDEANKGGNLAARIVFNNKATSNGKNIAFYNDDPKAPLVVSTVSKTINHTFPINDINVLKYYEFNNGALIAHYAPIQDFNAINDENARRAAIFNANILSSVLHNDNDRILNYLNTMPTASEDAAKKYNMFVNKLIAEFLSLDGSGKWTANYTGMSTVYTPIATWGQAFEMGRGSGPFFGIFVYPISYITNKLIEAMPMMHGWESFISIVLVVIFVSVITFLLSFKGTLQQTKMQELNAKKAIIDAKYAPYKGNKQMQMRQRSEVSELYKKEGISPLGSIGSMLITMPFFFAMWRVIGSIQHIKGTVWLGINFASTSWRELFAGKVQYLPLMALALGLQIFSQLYPRLLTKRRDKNRINVHQKAAMKKGNKTQNIMMVVFAAMSVIFAAGLQVYFVVRSLWRIVEVSATHHIIVQQRKNKVRKAVA